MTDTMEAIRESDLMKSIYGRMTDLDSHEHMTPSRVAEVLGDRAQRYQEATKEIWKIAANGDGNDRSIEAEDTMEITYDNVWTKKGTIAPSALNLDRRPEVLDTMGISRALIFPGMALGASALGYGGGFSRVGASSSEQQELAWAAVDAWNEYAATLTNADDRMRMVGIFPIAKQGMTVDMLVKEAKRQIKEGIKAFFIVSGLPPAGMSPADKRLDPLYATVAEANVPLVFHSGSEAGFMASNKWREVPAFKLKYGVYDAENHGDPYNTMNKGRSESNWLSAAILGGVFERHPTLRVAPIEVGAMWFGPMAEMLDFFASPDRQSKNRWLEWEGAAELSMKPSEYLARNVRVTPFIHEPIEMYFDRYPQLQDCYCFSSDFPHMEGTQKPVENVFKRLEPFGKDILDKFFCTNGELIVP